MKIGIVNGCFDVLHVGHIALLKYAHSRCDKLYVLIDSDERVKKSKGIDRPFNCEEDRAKMLLSIRYVNSIRVFDTHRELRWLCDSISADVHIVGEEYRGKEVVGGEFAKTIEFFPKVEGHSTTKILGDKSG